MINLSSIAQPEILSSIWASQKKGVCHIDENISIMLWFLGITVVSFWSDWAAPGFTGMP